MKYTYENQKKALEYLIENTPHDMEKFAKLYNIEVEEGYKARVSLESVLISDTWSTEEKTFLIKLYNYQDPKDNHSWNYKTYEREVGYMEGMEGLPLIDQCIKNNSYTGVETLLNLGNYISVATIKRIIEYIKNPEERYKYCELIVNHCKDMETIKAYRGTGNVCYLKEIPSLCDRYPEYTDDFCGKKSLWRTVSSMEYICATNDLKLVKLFLPTVKNIKPLFMHAVKTNNIEMVKMFIEAGADVNYQDTEFEADNNRTVFKTPIKIAIDNNNLEMVMFLHQNGADLNYVDKSERMQEYVNKLGREEEKATHEYSHAWDKHDYINWTYSPLEYAINLGAASIIDAELINNASTRVNDDIEKQFKDRAYIVKYLYDNGAKFTNGEVNYTDLICYAIKSDNFEDTEYYFKEAYKAGSKLDFNKIISFIHIPGHAKLANDIETHYKYFEEGATPWFNLCLEYSEKLDNENHLQNIKNMLEKLFADFAFNEFQFNKYRETIKDFTSKLPKETLKDIPAIFHISLSNLEEILALGYDINSTNEYGYNLLMHYILNKRINMETLNKLLGLGLNINYIEPKSGMTALSCIISCLPRYNFGKFIENVDYNTKELKKQPTEYESVIKEIVKTIIDLSNNEIIMGKRLKSTVCCFIEPGYPQIIYNEILQQLSSRGFKVDDEYVSESVKFLGATYSLEYVSNPWAYLWNLYNNFSNKALGTNFKFPKVKNAQDIKYGTKESKNFFSLLHEHIKRNFVTSLKELPEPDKVANKSFYYDYDLHIELDRTALQFAQDTLLNELSRYIGILNYHHIIALIDDSDIITPEALNRNGILPQAIKVRDKKLCKELIKRGATIVCYDPNGHDITSNNYSEEDINFFRSVAENYNPNKECEDLLAAIGISEDVSLKKVKPSSSND